MFRGAAVSPYDEGINKATDENLTSEDWGAIIDLCDKVSSDPNGPNQVTQGLIKRLAHRNANVQLYTLELANALSQNCGKGMHRELASRSFTDSLLKLANDRNTHQQVKAKILERMKEWSDMFSKDADLGIMYDAYYKLKQTNPTLQAPSAPQKTGLTDLDRQKEEDELQMALQLSLQEEERKKSTSAAPGPSSGAGQGQAPAGTTEPVPSHPTGTTAATVSRVRALYDFVPSEPGELEFKKGDVIAVLESVFKDWWRGSLKGNTGIFPLNYVEKLTDPTPDEMQREAQMEAEVFAEIKNVEKLLTLLSTSNTAPREEDNEEISKLYHQTLAIRPKLIKLIEKYSQKKDDFTQLNEKFIKARRDYESLLESSMAHPPSHNYHHYGAGPPMPQGYGAPTAPGYAPQGAAPVQQDPQRYYTPGPQGPPPQEHNHYQAASPPPNIQRPGTGAAPFYLQGTEIPPQGSAPPAQAYPPQGAQPPAQRYQPQANQPPSAQQYPSQPSQPPAQQYPPRDQPSRIAAGKQPAPVHGAPSPGPQQQTYQAYSQQPPPQQAPHPSSGPRPQSTYGNPQELSGNAPEPYSASSMYSQDDPFSSPSAPPPAPSASPPGPPHQQGIPTALAIAHHPAATPTQPQYTAYQPQPQQPQLQNPYDTGAPSQAPPQPTTAAPPPPVPQGMMTPPPLQPGGPHYDARQSLPSQGPPPHSQQGVPGQQGQGQFKAYAPPTAVAGGHEPSAPQDYYRQSAAY